MGWVTRSFAVCAIGALLLTSGATAASGAARDQAVEQSDVLVVQTVPATAGARVSADGVIAYTNARGVARLPVENFEGLSERFNVPETRVSEDRKVILDRIVGTPDHGVSGRPIVVGLRTERLIRWDFVDRGGREVPVDRISLMTLKSNTGETVDLTGEDLKRPLWMAAGRTQQTPKGLVGKELYWSVNRVVVDGGEVINRGQQVFVPEETQHWTISLLFYRVVLVGRDLLFGSLAGAGVEVVRPDGSMIRAEFVNGQAVLDDLPRGQYDVHVFGHGASFTRPMSISKDQLVEIEVITRLDLGLIVTTLLLIAISLVLVGRRHHLPRLRLRRRKRTARHLSGALAILLAAGIGLGTVGSAPHAEARPAEATTPLAGSDDYPPTFAYYYIWFQPTSWQRAKIDYPLLGRYSSDDDVVMRRHVEMAKASGLTGFLVSWKDMDHLSERLAKLVAIAEEYDFKLGIVYQGLDFHRDPLPIPQIAADLNTFADRYAGHRVFDAFGEPVVVITGTEKFSVDELRRATAGADDRLQILASAKSVEDYVRTAPVVDGNAYYWSSSDPRVPSYQPRLDEIGEAVHADGGLWVAPAAPGFDARLIGGRQVIDREGGETLRVGLAAAKASRADVIGLISWNEFSENTHVEPSREYGAQELHALADVLGGTAELPEGLGSDEVTESRRGLTGWGALLTILLLTALLNFVLAYRRSRAPRDDGAPTESLHRSGVTQ